jgi:hypothetical protein
MQAVLKVQMVLWDRTGLGAALNFDLPLEES